MPERLTRANLAAMIAGLALAVACAAQNPPAPPAPPVASQPAGADAPPAALDPEVDRILSRLENREVRELRADVSWTVRYLVDLEQDAITKKGKLWYQQAQPVPRFLVHFTAKIAGQRKHKLDERHLFDGRWYTELNSETKTLTRREVRREGDPANPYRLGEGPFPVPFGQKKADILREFDVRLVPGPTDPPDTDHLMLVPRPGTQTGREHKQVDVWIAHSGAQAGLPIKVYTSKKDGTGQVNSYLTIEFDDIELNKGFSGSVFKLDKPAGYEEVVETLDPIPPPP